MTDLGTTFGGGVLAHAIAHGLAKMVGDGQLMRGLPGGGRGGFDRAIGLVADPSAVYGDGAEDGFEGERSGAAALDALAHLAVTLLQDELGVGLFDQSVKELSLDLQADVMNDRLNLMGQVGVLLGQRQSQSRRALLGNVGNM